MPNSYGIARGYELVPPLIAARTLVVQKELHECVQHIQDPPTLRAHVTAMYKSNVDVDLPRNEMDANVIHEYHRHKVSWLSRYVVALARRGLCYFTVIHTVGRADTTIR